MTTKRFLTLFLALCMLASSIPISGIAPVAVAQTDVWDGTADTSWYDASDPQTAYHFTKPEQLAGLARLVNSTSSPVVFSTSTTFYLDNDIYLNDLSDYENWENTAPANNWDPIGNSGSNNRFQGNFDGQGHTIYGMYCKVERTTSLFGVGLFGCSKYGNISNLNLRSALVVANGTRMSASVVGFKTNGGTLSNVTSNARIIDTTDRLSNETAHVGGIIGLISNAAAAMENCCFTGSIDYTNTVITDQWLYAGGLVGLAEDIPTLTDCYNDGTINVEGNKAQTGGLIGRIHGNSDKAVKATRCYNSGSIIGGTHNTGGLFGYNNDTTSVVTECYNSGNVTATTITSDSNDIAVGGIFGKAKGKYTYCYNTGIITNNGTGCAAGIGGYIVSAGSSITGVYNAGGVSGNGTVASLINISDLGTSSSGLYYLAGTAEYGTVYLSDSTQNDTKWAAVSCTTTSALSDAVITNVGGSFTEDVGNVNNGLPVFNWQESAATQAAAEVDLLISALPEIETLTLDDSATVSAARAAYSALSDYGKSLVTGLNTLIAAEKKIAVLYGEAGFVNLICNDADNNFNWVVRTNAQVGDQAYSDRKQLFFDDSLPEELVGCDWIRTAMNSKSWNAGNVLCSFDVYCDTDLYVAWPKAQSTPDWLNTSAGWENTETSLTFWNSEWNATHDSVMQLYRREVYAGEHVELGCLGTASAAIYLVFLQHQTPEMPEPSLPQKTLSRTVRVACVGDSITYGSGATDRSTTAYPAQLQSLLGDSYDVRNFGLGGTTLMNSTDKPYTAQTQYTDSLAFEPDIVIIMLGTNDSKPKNSAQISTDYKIDYLTLIKAYQALSSNPKIYIATSPFCPNDPESPGTNDIIGPVIEAQIVPLQKEIAEETGLELIDIFSATWRQSIFPDSVHPNDEGYRLLAKTFYTALYNYLPAGVTDPNNTPADYTAVDAALDKAAALTEGDYTEASWAKLQTAVNAVVRDLTASEQATVDGYAAAIEAAILALVPASAEMELTIGTGMVTAAAEGKYDITWNAHVLVGDTLAVEDINAAGVKFKNYGVYYSTGKDVLDDYKNASADQIRKIVFAQGEDVDVYTAYGFRLKNVTENRVRAAMFYIEYELNGQSYILLSTVDEVVAVIAA
ncbi:MAG: GDSL-type esterase/lipase family protein [Candidatus Howiella sp.]|jgi:acyl-CoA thioesterase-1